MTHAELAEHLPSASGFDANFRCPGKWLYEKEFPDEESSSDAVRGHRIHEALEKNDLSGLSPSEYFTASLCLDIEAQLSDLYGFEAPDTTVWEKRYWDVDDEFNKLWSVQLDLLRITGQRGLIVDYKTGWGIPVPIAKNWQLRAQSAIVWFHHGLKEVVAALAHPHHPEMPMQVAVYSDKQCAEFLMTIRGWVHTIQTQDQPRIPSTFNCQFCAGKNTCPERQQLLSKIGKDIWNEVQERGYTALLDRNPEERGEHVRSLKELKKHIELVLGQYTTMAVQEDGAVAGWRPTKKWDRAITDDDKALEIIERDFGKSAAAQSMLFSLTECEAVVGKALGIGREKAREKIEELLRDLIRWKKSESWLIESRNYQHAVTKSGETHTTHTTDTTQTHEKT